LRVYYTTANNGDGSSSVKFFESQECIDLLEEHDPDSYGSGEGGSYFDIEGAITFQSNWEKIQTLEQVKALIEE
jgi:hypothetical protein